MNVNASLFGQMITFAIFVWFTMKFVWPHIMSALEERKKTISDGLAAGERGQRELELAQHKSAEMIKQTKLQSAEMLDDAKQRANRLVEEAKGAAREEGKRQLELAKGDIEQEKQKAHDALLKQFSALAVAGAEKILQKSIDASAHAQLMDELIQEVEK